MKQTGFTPILLLLVAIPLIIVLYFIISSSAGSKLINQKKETDITSWATYKNTKYGFSLDYPEAWFLTGTDDSSPLDQDMVIYINPKQKNPTGILVRVFENPNQDSSLKAATSLYESDKKNNYIKEDVNGYDATLIQLNGDPNQPILYIVKDNVEVLIDLAGKNVPNQPQIGNSQRQQILERIIKTFKFSTLTVN